MKKWTFTLISFLSLGFALSVSSVATAQLIADFTAEGPVTGVTAGLETQMVSDPNTGVSFIITATDVSPPRDGFTGGLVTRNSGLGSNVRNAGTFLNFIDGDSEELEFTITNVIGLAANQSLVLTDLLSQNPTSQAIFQTDGHSGTFGEAPGDDVLLTSDLGNTFRLFQSNNSLGEILLNTNGGDDTNTGNTFAHSANDFVFDDSFTVQLTSNDAVEIQGFRFAVVTAVPEPSSAALLGLGALGFVIRRRRS